MTRDTAIREVKVYLLSIFYLTDIKVRVFSPIIRNNISILDLELLANNKKRGDRNYQCCSSALHV